MGQYTEIDIQIPYEKQTVADAICDIIHDFKSKVKEHILKDGEPFDHNITDVDDFGDQVEIKLNSSSQKNAEWQLKAIIKILQEEKIVPLGFNSDLNNRGFICLDCDDFLEYDTKL